MMGDNQQRLAHAQITDSNFPTKYFVLLQTNSHNNLELFWTLLNLVRIVKVVAGGGGGGESGGRECAVYFFDLLVHAWTYSETPYEKKTEILAWCGFCAQYFVSPCDSHGVMWQVCQQWQWPSSHDPVPEADRDVKQGHYSVSQSCTGNYWWLYMHISRKQEKKGCYFFFILIILIDIQNICSINSRH